jgi:sorbose reductase
VQDSAAIGATIDSVLADFGRLDIVVANAGVTLEKDALEYTPDEFRRVMSVNLDGAFYTAQAAGRAFKGQREGVNAKGFEGGSLIVTSSVSSHLVNLPQKQAAYNASKAGIEQLAKCLAVEWVGFARVNCVCPGFIATDSELRERWQRAVPLLSPSQPCRSETDQISAGLPSGRIQEEMARHDARQAVL